MVTMNEEEILEKARHRYHTDAMFHARVERTIQLMSWKLRKETGTRMDENHKAVVGLSAAVTLVMMEMDP